MKRIVLSTVALFLLALAPASAQRKATIQNVPEIPFTTAPNFLKLPPGEYLGEAVAVATNSKGHVFVFHRSQTNRLFNSTRPANSSRKSAVDFSALNSRIPCAAIRTTISGPSTKVRTWSPSSAPKAEC